VVVEGERKDHSQGKQQPQHLVVINSQDQQRKETHSENYQLRSDHVRQYRTDKEAILPLEQCTARTAVMANVEWTFN